MYTRYLFSYCRYALLVALLLLLNAQANAHSFFQPKAVTKHAFVHHKNQSTPRLFLIAVIDSDDETIGERCKEDLNSIEYIFNEMDYWLDAEQVEPKIIQGSDFSKAAVNDALDNWLAPQQPTANDIVIFYYSGHGFRDSTDVSNYPRMWLKTATNKDVETNNLRLEEDVYNRIIKMGAGFNLVLADCCNTTNAGDNVNFDNILVPTRKREAHKKGANAPANDGDDDANNAEKLFMPGHPVSILATASEKGEFAAGKAEVGGFFTCYFTDAMEDCLEDNKLPPVWQDIFKYADEKASYWAKSAVCPNAKHNEQGRCVQTAEFKVVEP